ncbi:MAG: hypothetical protein C0404_09990 [Verrucomicrobia bacterium]|nr:hypothetical protein [Verrucomicrobiota bacterium]
MWRGLVVMPMLAYSFHHTCPIWLPPILIIAAAIILGPQVTRLIVEPAGSIFMPDESFDKPQPIYSIPDRKRAVGLYEEAMEEYRKIADNHPEELKPHISMIQIAAIDMKNIPLATEIYRKSMASLRNDKKKDDLTAVFRHLHMKLKGTAEHFSLPPPESIRSGAEKLKRPISGFQHPED